MFLHRVHLSKPGLLQFVAAQVGLPTVVGSCDAVLAAVSASSCVGLRVVV